MPAEKEIITSPKTPKGARRACKTAGIKRISIQGERPKVCVNLQTDVR